MEKNNGSILINLFTSGFLPGFISTLTFHQIALTLFWSMGLVGFAPYSLDPTQPLGVPAVLSLAFWGGIWSILYKVFIDHYSTIKSHWQILAGTLLPTITFILIVAPLKGIPLSVFSVQLIIVAVLINLAWAMGTIFLSQRLDQNRPISLIHQ